MRYFIVENVEVSYGDYGDIICVGYIKTFYYEKVKYFYNNVEVFKNKMKDLDVAELTRTGPYIPEIYVVYNINGFAMTENFMNKLKLSDLKGIANIKPTIKKKIINLPWRSWDAESWEKYIEMLNEPEDILEKCEHDEALANSMPNVFYFVPIAEDTELLIENEGRSDEKFILEKSSDLDVFRASNMLHCIISENFKRFLDENYVDNLSYIEILTKR